MSLHEICSKQQRLSWGQLSFAFDEELYNKTSDKCGEGKE